MSIGEDPDRGSRESPANAPEVPVPPPGVPWPEVPPPGHGQAPPPPPGYYAAPPTRTNGFSIASMVLGILWIWWIGSILALVFGYIAKGQIDRSQGRESGRGMAIAGIVLGWIGIGILGLFILLIIIGASSEPY